MDTQSEEIIDKGYAYQQVLTPKTPLAFAFKPDRDKSLDKDANESCCYSCFFYSRCCSRYHKQEIKSSPKDITCSPSRQQMRI